MKNLDPLKPAMTIAQATRELIDEIPAPIELTDEHRQDWAEFIASERLTLKLYPNIRSRYRIETILAVAARLAELEGSEQRYFSSALLSLPPPRGEPKEANRVK